MNILIAEDEKDIRELLKISLENESYIVFATSNGIDALEVIKNNEIDLAILDVMMPRLDGFNLLRKIRQISNIPVIFLTAKGDDMDKVLGLGIGADDYLVKPFSITELIARVGAHLRRNTKYLNKSAIDSEKIVCGELCLDKSACCVILNNTPIDLNAKEYLLLKYLMENPNRVFTKKQLYRAVWDEEIYYDDNTIMVHISHLRTKIEADSKNPRYIKTIKGLGYKLHKPNEDTK